MNCKQVDLRPDSRLLDPNFTGYKLSLQPVAVLQQNLIAPADVLYPSDDQYSFLHSKLFECHNHLVRDNWSPGTCYFVDVNFTVQQIQYDNETGQPKKPISVFRISRNERHSGDYNISFMFISEEMCLLNNGSGILKFLNTGNRNRSNEWKETFSIPLTIYGEDDKRSLLIESRLEQKSVHIVLLTIVHRENAFHSLVTWKRLHSENNQWSVVHEQQLICKGYPTYCSLEPKSKSLIIASEHNFKFVYDSLSPIIEQQSVNIDAENETTPLFSWSQNDEDITINIKSFPNACKSEFKVVSRELNLEVYLGSEKIVCLNLFSKVDSSSTTWSWQNNYLQIVLIKQDPIVKWPCLADGEQMDSESKETINIVPSLLANTTSTLETMLEECDVDPTGEEQEYYLSRLNGESRTVDHKVYLGSTPPLFSVNLMPEYPDAIVLRHDVDGCVWSHCIPATNGDQTLSNWTMRHEGTLHAFGYILASKQQRKFIGCCPNFDYSIICEYKRHIFIYKTNYENACGLRKRTGPQMHIGQQQLVELDQTDEILGMVVENQITFILTKNTVLCLQINIEE